MSPKAEVRKSPDQEKLNGALQTIVDAVLGDELDSMRKSVTTLDSSVSERVETLKQQLTEVIDKLKTELGESIQTVKGELEQGIAEREQTVRTELDHLAKGLSGLQFELQQQVETTGRVSGALGDLARVLSPLNPGGASMPPSGEGQENLENALDQMFELDGATAKEEPSEP